VSAQVCVQIENPEFLGQVICATDLEKAASLTIRRAGVGVSNKMIASKCRRASTGSLSIPSENPYVAIGTHRFSVKHFRKTALFAV
jgi:hypothetical protein